MQPNIVAGESQQGYVLNSGWSASSTPGGPAEPQPHRTEFEVFYESGGQTRSVVITYDCVLP